MKEESTMMGGFGNGMGSLGWLGMGVLFLLLVGLIVWLVVRPRDRNWPPMSTGLLHVERTNHHLDVDRRCTHSTAGVAEFCGNSR
jgi:hypothetical protein